jgi:hypothetical protein
MLLFLRTSLFAFVSGGAFIASHYPNLFVLFATLATLVLAGALAAYADQRILGSKERKRTQRRLKNRTHKRRFVIAHPALGVYLGSAGNVGLWSAGNHTGRRDAHGLKSIHDANDVIRRYVHSHSGLTTREFRIAGMDTTSQTIALRECAKHGLPIRAVSPVFARV